MTDRRTIGIIGGGGMLGSAIADALLRAGTARADIWISGRAGAAPLSSDDTRPKAGSNQDLVEACDLVVLSVPPDAVSDLGIDARDRLVVSVMAGVTLDRIMELTGTKRAVRAMSSPAARFGLAYSPFVARGAVTDDDRTAIRRLFEACGLTDEVADEAQIDLFTALTGPVPGFVAYYADCMVRYAIDRGVAPEIADRAIRQLFRASGEMLATAPPAPADHVAEMIAYAGTTAAGLQAMQASPVADAIAQGLDAAVAKARTL